MLAKEIRENAAIVRGDKKKMKEEVAMAKKNMRKGYSYGGGVGHHADRAGRADRAVYV